MKKERIKEVAERVNELDDSMHTQDMQAYWLREWIGAMFYYFLNRGKIPFEKIQTPEKERKNVWTGFAIVLIIFLSIIGIAIFII